MYVHPVNLAGDRSAYYGSSGGDRLTEAELAFRREREFEERERDRDREYAREKQRERERDVRELHKDREPREDEETREFARREPNANIKRALSGSPDLPVSYAQHAHAQQRYDDDKGALMKELSHPANGSSRVVGGSMGNGIGERDRDRDGELPLRNGIGAVSGNGSVPGGPMDSALVVSRNGGGGGGGGTAVELPTKSLFEAITQNDVREIQLIIASGEDIDAMLPEADTIAIILASKLCFNGIMELLIGGHANLDSQDRKGWTALHWTAVMNNIEGLSLLLNAGANIQARTQAGKSPLDLATIKDHDHAINFLQRHMDPNRQDLDGDGRDRVVRSCIECGSTKTPQWRRGPDGSVCLCNACGLRHIKSSKKKAKAAQKPGEQTQGLPSQVPTQQAQAQQAQAQQAQAQAQAQQAQQRNMPGGLGMGGNGDGTYARLEIAAAQVSNGIAGCAWGWATEVSGVVFGRCKGK
ncbi:hypothetical protein SARC_09038 [Sphaeroforma arctica JP610]|uniref:GATA-type domain-containing protein n=1 Tax=Sphaeroforma arctica JP610 TaxID=667725 RepID=A0A0L0FP71_9EUKA|nr:hypothetical protein SARC_09038 [Sphaeroforma arctica JP610]KNC78534.1 hypothetical protein SARC_09038 [Sphaeroforma arctica JP610]|eukprot:XP_014152436.1 hypothetical protein SARC_09038 [Sphaeroforma arctica JP610]